jgi:PAS domain-containing protein
VANSDADSIHWWSGFLASVAGWGGVAIALLLGFWRWIYRAYCGLRVSMRFAARWGVDADTHWATVLDQFERAKCESELRAAIIERTLGLGVFAADPAGFWTWCNNQCAELLGRDTRDCLGRLWLVAVSERDRERVARDWRLCVSDDVPVQTHFALTENDDDPRVGIEAWPVKRGSLVIGYIGQIQVWPGDDPPSWIRRVKQ